MIYLIPTIVCIVVILLWFLGIKWGLIALLCLCVATPFIVFQILKNLKNGPATTATPGATTATSPKGPKGSALTPFLVVLVVGLIITVIYLLCHQDKKPAEVTTSGSKTPDYEWTWELPPGQMSRGLNRSAPMVAEIIPRNDGALWINTPYIEYGRPEMTRFRLSKISDKSWEGTWEQDNPEDHGRCELHEVSPGTWAGHMTGKEGASGLSPFCTLKRK